MEYIPILYDSPLSFSPCKGYGCIYKYTVDCVGDGWCKSVYVGQTRTDLQLRHRAHIQSSSKHGIFDKVLKKHAYTIQILWVGPIDKLNEAEQFFIKKEDTMFPNGLNMTSGGDVNTVISLETRKAMSIADKNRDYSHFNKPVVQYDLSGNFIHQYSSLSEAQASSKANISHISSAIHGKRSTAGGYRWSFPGETPITLRTHYDYNEGQFQRRRVAQISNDGEIIRVFSTVCEAQRETGFVVQGISRCARGERKRYKGYEWKYIDG